jgi:hypothetical protein
VRRTLEVSVGFLFPFIGVFGLAAIVIAAISGVLALNHFFLSLTYFLSFSIHMTLIFLLLYIAKKIIIATHNIPTNRSNEPTGYFLPDAILAIKTATLTSMIIVIIFMAIEPMYNFFILEKRLPELIEPLYSRLSRYRFNIEILLLSHHQFYFFVITPILSIVFYYRDAYQSLRKFRLFVEAVCLPFIFLLVYYFASFLYLKIWPSMAHLLLY